MPVRIALVVDGLRGGGTERIVVTLANALYKHGYEVDLLIAGDSAAGPYTKDIKLGIRFAPLGIPENGLYLSYLRRSKNIFLAFWYLLVCVYKYLRYWKYMTNAFSNYIKKRTPLLFICSHSIASVVSAISKTSQQNIRTVAIVHTMPSYFFKLDMSGFNWRIFRYFLSFYYKKIDKVIGVSKGVMEDLLSQGITTPTNTCYIYNPANLEDIKEKLSEYPDHIWFREKTAPVFLAAGRLAPEKSYDVLLKAFSLVKEKRNCKLIIIGEGYLRDSLESLSAKLGLNDSVSMPGFVSNPYSYMYHADVFVLSSFHEGLPTVLVEALACGTTCVSTDCISGPDEILKNGKYGYLVPVGSPEALAEGMLKALEEPFPKETSQRRAEDFSDDKIALNYIELINSLTC